MKSYYFIPKHMHIDLIQCPRQLLMMADIVINRNIITKNRWDKPGGMVTDAALNLLINTYSGLVVISN